MYQFLKTALLLVAMLGAYTPQLRAVPILLEDNFNDGSIDGGKWAIDTSANGAAAVIEQNGKLELHHRGYLISNVAGVDPVVDGPIKITGEITFAGATFPSHDNVQIVTRSDGIPFDSFGEVKNGLAFIVVGNDDIRIVEYVDGVVDVVTPFVPLQVDDGDSFTFEVIDTGTLATFTVTEIGGQGAFATVNVVSNISAAGKIAFYNRELAGNVSKLDNIVVERVPEPSSVFLTLLSLVALVAICRSRNRGAVSS